MTVHRRHFVKGLLGLLGILPRLATSFGSTCAIAQTKVETIKALTSLSNPSIRYKVPGSPFTVLTKDAIDAVVVDNRAVTGEVLQAHRAGYSGIALLRHREQQRNIFVPDYSGLNFEHIHDGTLQADDVLFEPRRAPMELRVINDHRIELYQLPTPHWKLESATRYELMERGAIEMSFECIPHAANYANGYIGLFWASYIDQPESVDIHFLGPEGWIRGISPTRGEKAVHRAIHDDREFAFEAAFAKRLTLPFSFSEHRYREPWYFGIRRGMALAFIFRSRDMIRLTQAPSGAGIGNPAWDFQYFIEAPEVGKRYQMVMRALYLPYKSHEQVQRAVGPHLRALDKHSQ
ncbi:MAG TPA: hypothetical protein VGJ48_23660 [Pyrinomonadaceae bacterium]|jgi:hypothetical protein